MLFSIDEDQGGWIIGWIMPNNPNTTPVVEVHLPDGVVCTVPAMHYRPLLKTQGLHNTGICGFVCDENNTPGLGAAEDLAIYCADTGVLIYRRPGNRKFLQTRCLHLETRLFAASKYIATDNFQMAYRNAETLPDETLGAVLGIAFSASIFVSGRLNYQAFAPIARDRGFKVVLLLRDPLDELAERLTILKWAAANGRDDILVHFGASVPDTKADFGKLDLQSAESVAARLGALSPATRRILSNPVVRQLTQLSPDDEIDPFAVSIALDVLADFAAVGFDRHLPIALETFQAVTGDEGPVPDFAFGGSAQVAALAASLRTLPVVAELIELDQSVYRAALQAHSRVGAS